MHRPMVDKIQEEIKAKRQSERQILETIEFAHAQLNANRRERQALQELLLKVAGGQLELDIRPRPDVA